jgi:hypothetical protein
MNNSLHSRLFLCTWRKDCVLCSQCKTKSFNSNCDGYHSGQKTTGLRFVKKTIFHLEHVHEVLCTI